MKDPKADHNVRLCHTEMDHSDGNKCDQNTAREYNNSAADASASKRCTGARQKYKQNAAVILYKLVDPGKMDVFA
jgi:hypothetical protein